MFYWILIQKGVTLQRYKSILYYDTISKTHNGYIGYGNVSRHKEEPCRE